MILNNKDFKVIVGKDVPAADAPAVPVEEDKKELLYNISEAIREGGYDPVSQLVGYLISDDPTHISNCQKARTMINRIDRDELIYDMVESYLNELDSKYRKEKKDD